MLTRIDLYTKSILTVIAACLVLLAVRSLQDPPRVAAFQQDAIDNKAMAASGKLTMPVLAIGADKSFGAGMADDLRFVASDVTSVVIPNSGHWLMEEQPAATIAAIHTFLDKK